MKPEQVTDYLVTLIWRDDCAVGEGNSPAEATRQAEANARKRGCSSRDIHAVQHTITQRWNTTLGRWESRLPTGWESERPAV